MRFNNQRTDVFLGVIVVHHLWKKIMGQSWTHPFFFGTLKSRCFSIVLIDIMILMQQIHLYCIHISISQNKLNVLKKQDPNLKTKNSKIQNCQFSFDYQALNIPWISAYEDIFLVTRTSIFWNIFWFYVSDEFIGISHLKPWAGMIKDNVKMYNYL